eukprot:15342306-Ditylum_brightwellii.AAC.1
MQNAELHLHLSPNQYGGHKGKSAINIPVITVFNLDTLYFMQANMTFTYCDAQACFDRIVAIMSALSEQATGLAPEQTYGPSKEKNYHSVQCLVHGIGQGPTDRLTNLTCTVNTALYCYDKQAKGAILKDPTGQI